MPTTAHKTSKSDKNAKSTPKSNLSKAANGKARSNGNSSPKGENSKLEEFFHDEIKDIYWAEKKTSPNPA